MRQVYHFPQQAGKRRDFDFEQKDFLNHGNWKYAILSAVEQQYLNIAIVPNIAGASGRDHLSGVLKYINTGKRWSPRILNTPDDLMRACAGRNPPDGIVTITPPGALNRLLAFDIPTVVTDHPPAAPERMPTHVSFVQPDDEEVGILAARHLLSRASFNSFAIVLDEPDLPYARARERGFRREIASRGTVKTFILDSTVSDSRLHETFRRTLLRLPKPLAVLAARDRAALAVFDACRRLNLDIPEQVAILGIDNDELICSSTTPTLSSILPDHVGIGFRAAQELDRLLRGKPGTCIVLPNSVKDLVLRDSTRIVPPAGRLVQAALSFIEANAMRNLRVGDVVRHLGVSRRLADLRFRQIQHETIHDAIARARIGLVKKRLVATRDPLAKIAKDCGFRSCAALACFFLREVGMTMTSWRSKS
jgi:LacI family transcriptional regulator